MGVRERETARNRETERWVGGGGMQKMALARFKQQQLQSGLSLVEKIFFQVNYWAGFNTDNRKTVINLSDIYRMILSRANVNRFQLGSVNFVFFKEFYLFFLLNLK